MRFGFVAALAAVLLTSAVYAHDADRPELNPWMKTLTNSNGGYCCDGDDAVHVTDADWRVKDGHYQVHINQYMDGKGAFVWVDVPDGAIVKGPNKDGRTLVWPIWGNQPSVRCFMPGAGS